MLQHAHPWLIHWHLCLREVYKIGVSQDGTVECEILTLLKISNCCFALCHSTALCTHWHLLLSGLSSYTCAFFLLSYSAFIIQVHIVGKKWQDKLPLYSFSVSQLARRLRTPCTTLYGLWAVGRSWTARGQHVSVRERRKTSCKNYHSSCQAQWLTITKCLQTQPYRAQRTPKNDWFKRLMWSKQQWNAWIPEFSSSLFINIHTHVTIGLGLRLYLNGKLLGDETISFVLL